MNSIPGAVVIEGHIQGLSNTRSLGELRVPVIVVDKTNCIARYSKYCTGFQICPEFISDDFATFLIELAQKENLQGWVLIPSNDHAVLTISKHKNELEKYYKVITPVLSIIETIYDKARLLELANQLKIPIPLTINNADTKLINSINFPALIKGRKGLSFFKAIGAKAIQVNNLSELQASIESIEKRIEISDTITQELIPDTGKNKTISFTIFADKGIIKTYWAGKKNREHPIRFGTATFCESIDMQLLLEPSQVLINRLDYSGVCEIEYLFDPRDKLFKLIEINPRTWLWVGLAKACGVDYAKMLYNHFYGNNAFPDRQEIQMNICWSNRLTDCFFSIKAIVSGKLNVREFIKSYKGTVIGAAHSRYDIKPGIVYFFFLIKYLRTR